MEHKVKETRLSIGSPEFENKGFIPAKFTCEGLNVSPRITIGNIPGNTKSLALIVDDPDAPKGTFDHWILWNIPPMEIIAENTAPGIKGKNSFGKRDYQGPCPPSGNAHRYFFKVFALDNMLDIEAGSDKKALENAMKGHLLASGETIGMYERKK